MRRDGSPGYRSQDTIHFPYHHCNEDGISDGEIIVVPACDVRREFMS